MAGARTAELCVEVLYRNLPDQAFVPKKTVGSLENAAVEDCSHVSRSAKMSTNGSQRITMSWGLHWTPKFQCLIRVWKWTVSACHQLLTLSVESFPNADRIESIRVTDFSGPTDTQPYAFKALSDVKLTVHAYELHSMVNRSSPDRRNPQNVSSEGPGRVTILPNKALAGTWDSLVFEKFDPAQILRSIARISKLSHIV